MAKVKVSRPTKKQAAPKPKPVRGGSAISQVVPVAAQEEEGIHMSLYGRSGTGKTTLVSTFPKPLLLMDFHAGIRSIANVKGVETIRVEDLDHISELCQYQRENEKWATVVLDHATHMQELILQRVLGLDDVPAQLSWGIAKQQQWGDVAAGVKKYLRDLLGLSCNVVIVAQERAFDTDNESDLLMPYICSALTPSGVGYLSPAVDYIAQTFVREYYNVVTKTVGGKTVERKVPEMQYCLRTGPHPVYTTKFRSIRGHKIPDLIVNPTYEKIMKVVEGKPL